MRKIGFIALLFLAGLWSCEYETIKPIVVEPPETVSFSQDVEPIFTDAGCTGCHGAALNPDFRVGHAWASITNMGLVDTSDPAASILMEKINSGHGTSGNLTAEQKALILKWIEDGAKND